MVQATCGYRQCVARSVARHAGDCTRQRTSTAVTVGSWITTRVATRVTAAVAAAVSSAGHHRRSPQPSAAAAAGKEAWFAARAWGLRALALAAAAVVAR